MVYSASGGRSGARYSPLRFRLPARPAFLSALALTFLTAHSTNADLHDIEISRETRVTAYESHDIDPIPERESRVEALQIYFLSA